MTEESIYHRKESESQTADDAAKQIASQEMWGGPCRNYLSSDIPKVKAYTDELPLTKNREGKERGIEFTTAVKPDRGTRPGLAYWSGDREGVRNEGGYAKIKVRIKFCNQLSEVWGS
ncbi:hypothetical protein [Pseudanabaena sp. PCC 6802]|uniref:hypothetical protein n=1 Tax=Pseudanabaena sp. PCC 6802 TaxID=118173 RepID=UPI0012EAF6E9|nr:hypothetical protein [Pseudanabaena sp. PCC 6802]